MINLLNTFLNGITSGAIYSLMALSMVLVWRSTRVVNFAQAGMALLSVYFGYEAVQRTGSFWIGLGFAMLAGALVAALVEFGFMRLLLKHSSQGPIASVAPIIATLGLLGLIKGIIGFVWGNADILLEPPFSVVGFSIGEETLTLSPLKLLTLITVTLLLLSMTWLFQKTNLGLALRASAHEPEISRLAGVKVDLVRTLGWALAGAAGAAAGMLQAITGSGGINPDSIEFRLLLVFGFIAAAIGGLESMVGAVVGGMILGLFLAFTLTYIGGSLVFIAAFILLLVVLLIRPQGVIGQKAGRRA